MNEWLVFSSLDMVTWTEHAVPLRAKDFKWAIIDFKGKSYFIYQNGGGVQPHGGSFRRSVAVDELFYNPDGTMKQVVMTSEGVKPAKAE
ncbi:hypothetical protein [Pontibacter sp. 172403-2]|uniref:hypothetical protein n=1 Tax=Pontibacter rufus TaxID=2791028 RepID=UPI001E4E2FBD|nr:hypothetical protein [Pontibacter sp. 172403-2]